MTRKMEGEESWKKQSDIGQLFSSDLSVNMFQDDDQELQKPP